MGLNNMKIKSKMLIFFLATIVALMTTAVLLTTRLTVNAITDNLNPLQQVIGDIAAHSVTAGLELEDKDEVASALGEFTKQELFSYILVQPVMKFFTTGNQDCPISGGKGKKPWRILKTRCLVRCLSSRAVNRWARFTSVSRLLSRLSLWHQLVYHWSFYLQ